MSALPNFSNGGRIADGTPAQDVQINFSGAVHYRLSFVYDVNAGGYLRYMDGKLHVDKESGQPIVVKNIVIQRVAASLFPQSSKTPTMSGVLGRVTAVLSRRAAIPLYWRKYSSSDITRFTDDNLHPLPFQPGQTWIELVPLTGSVTITGPPTA